MNLARISSVTFALAGLLAGCGSGTEPISLMGSTPLLTMPVVDTAIIGLTLPYSQSGLGAASDGIEFQVNTALSQSVIAPAGGVVTYVDTTTNAAIVYILHGQHLMSRISKLQTASVQPGAVVQQGSGIGLVTPTANVVHFTLFYDNNLICPLSFLTVGEQKFLKVTSGLDPCI